MAWKNERPVFSRLPEKGYQDNPVADWLTAASDQGLLDSYGLASEFWRQTDPAQADPASLDWLAYLVGFSGSYWDTEWSETVKRQLITLSHSFIWARHGTLAVIERVLAVHGITYDLWQPGQLTLPFDLPGIFGGQGLLLYLRLPLRYRRLGPEWREAQRTLANYCPAITQSAVSYDRFYLGFSTLGDPLF